MATLMEDHPGWHQGSAGSERAMRCGSTLWRLTCIDGANVRTEQLTAGAAHERPVVDRTEAIAVTDKTLATLHAAVGSVAPVLRVRTGTLWEAVATAIIRQVIRADQARAMYRRFCQAHGPQVPGHAGVLYAFPDPQTVLRLSANEFDRLRMGFKRRALLNAAEAVLASGDTWATLDPPGLVEALQQIPRIGRWTGGAAAADVTGDFSVYPYADLAVRTWARRAAPDVAWPTDEPAFAALWRRATDQIGALTTLTLAWGGSRAQSPAPDHDRREDRPERRDGARRS